MTQYYELTILQGAGGQAHGINELGQVVGGIVDPDGTDTGSWWVPIDGESEVSYSSPSTLSSFGIYGAYITEIDVYGNVIPGTMLFNINQTKPIFALPSGIITEAANGLNNAQQIVSASAIYTYSFSGMSSVPIPPLNGQESVGLGINDLGDVVGRSSNLGFYLPNGGGIIDAGGGVKTCGLYAINNSKLAVGYVDSVKVPAAPGSNYVSPAWIDFGAQIPALESIQLPYPLGSPILVSACATAVNSGGTIVGWASGLLHAPTTFAFVYQAGEGEALDLNKHLVNNEQGWVLQYAWDINDKGQIVGLARKGNDAAGFVATPAPRFKIPRGI